jgi:hypothetical protein
MDFRPVRPYQHPESHISGESRMPDRTGQNSSIRRTWPARVLLVALGAAALLCVSVTGAVAGNATALRNTSMADVSAWNSLIPVS